MFTNKSLLRLLLSLLLIIPFSRQLLFAESSESTTESHDKNQKLDKEADEKKKSTGSKTKTSRDLRKEQITQLSFFLSPLGRGGDVDILISGQWSVGLTVSNWDNILLDAESYYKSYGVHFKRYFGNSFYIKPSLGWHKYEDFWMTAPDDPDDGYELSEGIGLHFELGNDWSFNRYFGVGVTYFAIGSIFDSDNPTSMILSRRPAVRLIGSF